jgi:hypothetical protein
MLTLENGSVSLFTDGNTDMSLRVKRGFYITHVHPFAAGKARPYRNCSAKWRSDNTPGSFASQGSRELPPATLKVIKEMKKKLTFGGILVLALVLTSGTFAYTYTNTTATTLKPPSPTAPGPPMSPRCSAGLAAGHARRCP